MDELGRDYRRISMAERSKDFGQPRPPMPPATAPAARPGSEESPKAAAPQGGTLGRRRAQYMIGSRRLPPIPPLPAEAILQALAAMPEIEIVRRLGPGDARA